PIIAKSAGIPKGNDHRPLAPGRSTARATTLPSIDCVTRLWATYRDRVADDRSNESGRRGIRSSLRRELQHSAGWRRLGTDGGGAAVGQYVHRSVGTNPDVAD